VVGGGCFRLGRLHLEIHFHSILSINTQEEREAKEEEHMLESLDAQLGAAPVAALEVVAEEEK